MPTQYSNFTTPDDQDVQTDAQVKGSHLDGNGQFMGDDKYTVPNGHDQYKYADADPMGFSTISPGGYDPNTGMTTIAGNGSGKDRALGTYGGYDGTWEMGPDGKPYLNHAKSGANADVHRFQEFGADAQKRGAYQNDYGVANSYGDMANRSRASQVDAMQRQQDMANYGSADSAYLGQSMLQQGEHAQRAAAISSGDPLAQVSAMGRQHNGVASYMQKGNLAMQAQQADDMAAGRAGYMNMASNIRTADQAGQKTQQDMADAQAANEQAQRHLNDNTERGYEDMAYDVNAAKQAEGIKSAQIANNVYTNAQEASSVAADRAARNQASTLNMASSAADDATDNKHGSLSDKRAKCVADLFHGRSR